MAEAADDPGWATISELARMRGCDKSAISRRVKRLEEQGLVHPRKERGVKLVNVAEFLRAADEHTDGIREANGRATLPSNFATDPVLAREQARKTAIAADLAQLDLDERLGKLVRVDRVEAAMARCGGAFVRAVDQMRSRAEDCAAAVARDGAAGARKFLAEEGRRLREVIANEMCLIAGEGDVEAAEPEEQDPVAGT